MVAPDGTRFPNRMAFLRIEAPRLIEVEHGTDTEDDPDRFRAMVIGFGAVEYGAVEYGAQTLDKLAAHAAAAGA